MNAKNVFVRRGVGYSMSAFMTCCNVTEYVTLFLSFFLFARVQNISDESEDEASRTKQAENHGDRIAQIKNKSFSFGVQVSSLGQRLLYVACKCHRRLNYIISNCFGLFQ